MTHRFSRAGRALSTGVAAVACAATLHAAADFQVNGYFDEEKPSGGFTRIHYICAGTPVCDGTFGGVEEDGGCSNSFPRSGHFQITGFSLSQPGALSGMATFFAADANSTQNANGTCTYTLTGNDLSFPYTGNWDGSVGTLTLDGISGSGQPRPVPGSFTASQANAAPVFPANVTSNITATTASVSGTIQPRAQDVGTSASIYVFVHAPSNLVQGAAAKEARVPPVAALPDDGAIVCVLAQVTSDGHLVAVSASTMQAYFTGVLGSQGQAVNILNNVSTPNVAGAAVYVGYGASASAMLANGIYQGAAAVPGPVQCATNLAAAPAPKSAGALSGLWWNASESGWGIHFTQRGKNLFAAWYTYDTAGNPKWYVAPNCGFTNANATSGSCTSALYEVDGPTFFGTTFHSPTSGQVKNDGTLQLTFQDANNATFTYTLGGFARTVAIVRQVFAVTPTATPAVDFTDLWWNPNESGWGMAMAQQFGNVVLAWYVYDANGNPFWYVAPACSVSGSSCSGTLYRTTGPAFGPPLDPTKVQAFAVGSAVVSFIDPNNAVLSYTVDGVSATKALTRQLF